MNLVIVESPSKAKTIQKYLGKDYKVIGSGGHVRDLPEKTLGIDIKNNYKPEYTIKEKMKKTVQILKKEVEKANKVYLATDPDREGEAISWHLKEALSIDDDNARIIFNEISKKAILSAINKPREINMNLVNAQQARRVLDRLVGYMLSPVVSRKVKSGLSAGRVQSAALRMIVDKEREIQAFVPEEYWNLYGFFNKVSKKTAQRAEFNDINGKKTKLTNKQQVEELLANLNSVNKWYVDTVKRGKSLSYPKPPFTTSTLQQDATTRFNVSSSLVMSAAQKLYEGVTIDGELIALVTYIRTDSVRVADDALNEVREHINTRYGKGYLPNSPNYYKSKGNAQDAHEAIRPISLDITPDSLEGKLDKHLLRLYRLIYDRFVASQMTPGEYDTLNIRIEGGISDKYGFKMTGRTLKFNGHLAAYNMQSDNGEDDTNTLPDYSEGEELGLEKLTHEQKFTQPSSRYTESTIVKAMEENGIGRPSTYATVISTLSKRFYIEKDKKFLKPTEIGMLVCEVMIKFFSDIVDLSFTAKMEDDLDGIDEERKWQDLINEFYPKFYYQIQESLKDTTKYKAPVEESDINCEKCGSVMLIRTGKYGKFYACSGFPKCKNIIPFDEPVTICPKCGGNIYKKRTKKGKIFYGCSEYPKCDFVAWDLPAPMLCTECGGAMRVDKDNRYVCQDRKCGKIIESDKAENN